MIVVWDGTFPADVYVLGPSDVSGLEPRPVAARRGARRRVARRGRELAATRRTAPALPDASARDVFLYRPGRRVALDVGSDG